jgi:hypothetical protein
MKLYYQIYFLLILISFISPLFGMRKARVLLEEYPKTSAFVAGAVTATCLMKMLNPSQVKEPHVEVRQLEDEVLRKYWARLPSFVTQYLYETKVINEMTEEQEETHILSDRNISSLIYKYNLPGKIQIISSTVEGLSGLDFKIRFMKKKTLPAIVLPVVTISCHNRELSILVKSVEDNNQAIDCYIDVPAHTFERMKFFIFDNERILYQKR